MIFYFIIFNLGNRCLGTNFTEHEMELVCVCKNPFHIGFYGETKTLFFEWENKHITRTRTVPLLPSHNTHCPKQLQSNKRWKRNKQF